jgi:hypothetical protein
VTWAFAILGLSPDADARAIKRAYAARLKTTRPDEDPEGFQRLNEAYQAALAQRAARDAAPGPRLSALPVDPPLVDPPLVDPPLVDPPPVDPATVARAPEAAAPEAAPPPAQDRAPVDAPLPPPAFPPPLPPVRWRTSGPLQDAFPANGPAAAPPFDMDAFFRELHARAGREPVAAFRAWLHGHEALYAMALKDAMAVPLVHFLAGVPPMRREHLDETLRFFGLDTVSPRTQRMEAALHRLRENALRDGPDWERIMTRPADGGPRRPASARSSGGSIPLWPILVGLYLLSRIVSVFTHP